MRIFALLLILSLAGCMSLRAQSYLDACLESGRNAGECKMLAHEIDMRVWRAVQDAGAAMQRAAPVRPHYAPRSPRLLWTCMGRDRHGHYAHPACH